MEYLLNPISIISLMAIGFLPVISLFFKENAVEVTFEYCALNAMIFAMIWLLGKQPFLHVMLGYFAVLTAAYFQLFFILLKSTERGIALLAMIAAYTALACTSATYTVVAVIK